MTEQKLSYNPNSFVGEHHYLSVRKATMNEICARRNVAFNPFDTAENDSAFPHATANIETRGEAVFAARNVIDGNWGNKGHGIYPFESWGIQRREDAFLKVEFGRPVTCDEIGILLRCDFPHDNWWHQVKVRFSDGSEEILALQKTSLPQQFLIHPRTATWAILCEMKKEEADPSPFPALCEFQMFGW